MLARPEPRLGPEFRLRWRQQKVRLVPSELPRSAAGGSVSSEDADFGYCCRHTRDQTQVQVFAQVLDPPQLHPGVCLENQPEPSLHNTNPAECGGKAGVLEFPSGSRAQLWNLSRSQLDLQRPESLRT